MISAQYFDGVSTRLHAVHLIPKAGELHIVGEDVSRAVPLADLHVREPFAQAPCIVQLADGAHCAVHQGAGRSALLAALAYRPTRVERLQQYWKSALGGVAAIAGLLVFSYVVLLPVVTDRIAEQMPAKTMLAIGDHAERMLEARGILEFSLRHARHHEALQEAFDRIKPAQSTMALRVKLRSGSIGANALALPNGSIVVTDAMVSLMTDRGSMPESKASEMVPWRFHPEVEERLAAIMAHEIAHLEQRHAARKLVRVSLTGAASWALLGDISGVVSASPVVFSQAQFSREMEKEADARAIALLKERGIPVSRLAEVFERLQALDKRMASKRKQTGAVPDWMKTTMGYLASHPAPAERIAAIRTEK